MGFRCALDDLHPPTHVPWRRQILLGGLEGDPNFEDRTGDGVIDNALPAGQPNSLADSIQSTIVTLPEGKTCTYCTIQFIWAARSDDGFYIGCSDISITTTGLLPDFTLVAPEVGNELPQ